MQDFEEHFTNELLQLKEIKAITQDKDRDVKLQVRVGAAVGAQPRALSAHGSTDLTGIMKGSYSCRYRCFLSGLSWPARDVNRRRSLHGLLL